MWIADDPFPRGDSGKVLKRVIQAEYAPLVSAS
jgi:hypothetical protein